MNGVTVVADLVDRAPRSLSRLLAATLPRVRGIRRLPAAVGERALALRVFDRGTRNGRCIRCLARRALLREDGPADTRTKVLPADRVCWIRRISPPQQARQLAADRQAQAGAAVLAAGAAVGLLERLEDDLLLVRRDADAGVGNRERAARCARAVQVVVVFAPADRRRARSSSAR